MFSQVIWHLLYDKDSAGDIGTLFAAKNFLHASNVPAEPMEYVDAAIDFLREYTKALILAAFDNVVKAEKLSLQYLGPEQEPLMNKILDLIIDKFALPSIQSEWEEDNIFKCKDCGKQYKKVASLRKHRKSKHGIDHAAEKELPVIGQSETTCPYCCKKYKTQANLTKHIEAKHKDDDLPFPVANSDETNQDFTCEVCKKKYKRLANLVRHQKDKRHYPEDQPPDNNREESELRSTEAVTLEIPSPQTKEEPDHILRYSCNALALGLLALNFEDARKNGDGQRIVRMYKLLFFLYRLDGRTKYTYYAFQFLCQVYYLLPPKLSFDLVWNRFVNTRGETDSNKEMDRNVEHWNKLFKLDCREFHGKVTDKSIQRASCSYQAMEELISNFEESVNIPHQSGKHTKANTNDDILALSEQLIESDIFSCKPGRSHQAFPFYPGNVFQQMDIPLLKEWMLKKIAHFKELNIYSKV